jgi:hypothetical protein
VYSVASAPVPGGKFRSLRQTLNRAGTKFLSFFHKPGLIVKRRPSHSIDPNPIAAINEDARIALAAHQIDNSGRYTHIQDLRCTSG